MRFASFTTTAGASWGAVLDDGITDIGARYKNQWPDLLSVVREGALSRIEEECSSFPADYPFTEIVFDIPLTRPGKILCIGVNYPDRNEEYSQAVPAHAYPSIFVRFPHSFVGHQQALIRPLESRQFDYEGEVAIVIGKPGRRITESAALDHVAAVTLANDGTLRDWVRHARFNVTQGKNFDRSGSMGPWLVPFHKAEQLVDMALQTRVNGEPRQSDRTGRMIFPVSRLISYVSTFATLEPGDIILTGTPTGAGARLDPPLWLEPGDVVEVEGQGVGILRNTVKDEYPQ